MAKQTIEIVAVDKTKTALRNIEQNTNRMSKAFGVAGVAAKAFIAAIAVDKILDMGRAVKDATAEFQRQQNALKLITTGSEDLARVTTRLRGVAVENRVAFADTVDLYTKLTLATQELGVSEEQVINVTGKLSQALAIAGADAATTSSVIRQFGQAMASGTVRGDEFNSIVEGLGPALIIMSRETGVGIGKLREMSRAGQLTAQTLFEMLENSNALTKAFNQMDPTIDQLETALGDAFDAVLIKIGDVTGATEFYENGVRSLTNSLNTLAGTNKLVEKSNMELFESAKDGSVAFADAIEELKRRFADLDNSVRIFGRDFDLDLNIGDFFDSDETEIAKNAIADLVNQLYELQRAAEEQKKIDEENAKVLAEQQKQIKAAIGPFKEFIDLAEKYEGSGFGSALVKNEEAIKKVKEAMTQLDVASKTVIQATGDTVISQERHGELMRVLQLELDHLIDKNKQLKEAQAEVVEEGLSYATFLEELIETTNKSVKLDEFKQKAITEISAQYRDGALSLQQYETAMKSLDSSFQTQSQIQEKQASDLKKIQDQQKKDIATLTESYRTHFMTQVQLAEDAAAKEKAAIQDALIFGSISKQKADALMIQAENVLQDKLTQIRLAAEQKRQKELQQLYDKNIAAFRAGKFAELKTAEMTEKQKVSFIKETGLMALDALGQHSKEAFQLAKAAAIAEAIINTAQGVTKALAQGGIFGPILAGVIVAAGAAQIATIKSQKFQGRQRGGAVAAGQSVITGEDGPELIVPKQPSTVIPREVAEAIDGLGGRSQPVTVNFNINTVDARDFDDLLIERRGTITGIINNAMRQQGRMGVV